MVTPVTVAVDAGPVGLGVPGAWKLSVVPSTAVTRAPRGIPAPGGWGRGAGRATSRSPTATPGMLAFVIVRVPVVTSPVPLTSFGQGPTPVSLFSLALPAHGGMPCGDAIVRA